MLLNVVICIIENLQEGAICAYRNSSGCYYRVQVLKFSVEQLEFCFHHKEKARVSTGKCITGFVSVICIDTGCTMHDHKGYGLLKL